MTTQLESQRHYFEERLADVQKENEDAISNIENKFNKELESVKAKSLKEKQALEKKLQTVTDITSNLLCVWTTSNTVF